VAEGDWFVAQARGYGSTLAAALHGNDIPESVVHTLISTTRENVEPLQRYHRLRRRALQLDDYHLYDGSIPLVADFSRSYPYGEVLPWIVDSVAPLGTEYQRLMAGALSSRWIDVYENEGKQSGAYAAGLYGVHPYVLLNYNDTIDDVFTVAHELGHALHTLLSQQAQPFRYARYTIFVAEVASTLNEALLLEALLARSDDPAERAVLLQHAIDTIAGTFYAQVLFAAWELEAHRLVEQGQPLTADTLGALYHRLVSELYGDAVTVDPIYAVTWARIPHFFRSPYYVYQYATCFASSASLLQQIRTEGDAAKARYLELLRAGASDHPMTLLARAGVDLRRAETVTAVGAQLAGLVDRLERELRALGGVA
jgi:oligoendopeptidase F